MSSLLFPTCLHTFSLWNLSRCTGEVQAARSFEEHCGNQTKATESQQSKWSSIRHINAFSSSIFWQHWAKVSEQRVLIKTKQRAAIIISLQLCTEIRKRCIFCKISWDWNRVSRKCCENSAWLGVWKLRWGLIVNNMHESFAFLLPSCYFSTTLDQIFFHDILELNKP